MADDLGFNDVGYSDPSVLSPAIDALARSGVRLGTCYTWNWCAPSRGAMLSGRYAPNSGFEQSSDGPSADGKSGVAVFPLKYSLLPQVLKSAGYRTVMAGKWHLGYVQQAYTPESRGFDEYLGYLTGAEDYYTHSKKASPECPKTRDLWYGLNGKGSPALNQTYFSGEYSTTIFTDFIVRQIEQHDVAVPLFLYAAYQGVHGPLEVPQRYFDLYKSPDCSWANQNHDGTGKYSKGFTCDDPMHGKLGAALENCQCNRILVKAQVSALSEGVGNITDALQRRGMWENTVLVFMGDNGGPTFEAHSNAPLRGGKLNFFEGGIRPAAFVTSPLLPKGATGAWYNGSVHETDWFATFVKLAGLEVPQGVDGVDFWPTLVDPATEHRKEVLIADGILRQDRWKLVVGADASGWQKGMLSDCMLGTGGGWLKPPTNNTNLCPRDVYTRSGSNKELGCPGSTDYPATAAVDLWLCSNPCTPQKPCLWDLEADPSERHECAKDQPEIVSQMLERLQELSKGFQNSTKVMDNGKFCAAATARAVEGIGPFLGPWVENGEDNPQVII